jgi:hypothetical protein
MNHPEIQAMQSIVEAVEPLTAAQRQAVGRWTLPTSDAEIMSLMGALAALKTVASTQARARVIRWALDAYKAPKVVKAKRGPKSVPSPVREAVSA